ncbi:MAG: NUDIX domain-containing protein [Patescibacteria group bacterium]|nr:NUDIX domain-containing protein [Patescibacteria group bacterium]
MATIVPVDCKKAGEFAEAFRQLGLIGCDALPTPTIDVDLDALKRVLALGLAFVDPAKPLGTELFGALCRVTLTVAVEAVALRYTPNRDAVEVLLTQRADNDPAYPGKTHCPGTALRPGETAEDAFRRLSKGEFFSEVTAWTLAGTWNNPHEERGHFFHLVYVCEVKEGSRGKWFPVKALPGTIVEHHRDHVIPMALTAFGQLTKP